MLVWNNFDNTMNDETNHVVLTDLAAEVIFMIAKHLKYDDIISMCLTKSEFSDFCESKYFWITYLEDVHDITGVNDLDIDLLKRGVQFIEAGPMSYFNGHHPIDEDLRVFTKVWRNNNITNIDHLPHPHVLYLGRNNKITNITQLPSLHELRSRYNNNPLIS